MSDLVRRLRDYEAQDMAASTAENLQALLKEAADRIEWLEGRAGVISAGVDDMSNLLREAAERQRGLWRVLNGGNVDAG